MKYIVYLLCASLCVFGGCKGITVDDSETGNKTVVTGNKEAEKDFEKHDTYKPWWSFQ